MKMNKLIASFLLCAGLVATPVFAEPNTLSSNGSGPKHVKLNNNKIKPRDVTHDNVVECTIENGWLTITFEEPEGWATVTLKDGGIDVMASGTYDTASIIKFPLLHTGNPIQILIRTSEGNEYEGWIE